MSGTEAMDIDDGKTARSSSSQPTNPHSQYALQLVETFAPYLVLAI